MNAPPLATGLSTRVRTAALLVPVFLGVWWWNFPPATALFFGLFLLAAAHEWATLCGLPAPARGGYVALVVGASALALWLVTRSPLATPFFLVTGLGWGGIACALVATQCGRDWWPTGAHAWAVLGCFALAPGYAALLWLQRVDRGALLGLFLIVWAADTAAYFAGRRWGRARLASRLSPGKTWVGALAAVASGLVLGMALTLWPVERPRPLVGMALVGGLVVVVSIFGDLFESLLKRRGGFKDSGTLLPGHGGVLDRIDSLLAAAPVYACALTLMAE